MRGFLLVLKIFLLYTAVLTCTSAEGQSTSDLALKNLQRQKWQRAYELLTKALAKDSLNVTAKYVLAQYFFSEDNPAYNLDSAYRHTTGALADFQRASTKLREKWLRFPVDSLLLLRLQQQIEATAFTDAKHRQSEESWIDFISRFPNSGHIALAIKQRDSIAYETAAQENTYDAFDNFLKKYPQAAEFSLASTNYEKLLFTVKTADQTLESYEQFVAEHPGSTYHALAEQTIFEYRTASGDYNDFIAFIKEYPGNSSVKKAKDILFHLILEDERPNKWPAELTTDSLSEVMLLEKMYLVPFLKNKKYGFMDSQGSEVIAPHLDSLDASYKCGNINGDVIFLPDSVIAKNGARIWGKGIVSVDDIGFGYLFLDNGHCKFLVHKSGFQVGDDCIADAKILNGRFAAVKKANQWHVFTLSGRALAKNLDDVFCIKDVICLKSNNQVKVFRPSTLATLPAVYEEKISEYDDVQAWNNNWILVRRGDQLEVLDQALRTIVPFSTDTLTAAFFGAISSTPLGYQVYSPLPSAQTFRRALAREPWLAVQDSLWHLVEPASMEKLSVSFDTVVFSGPFAIGQRQDTTYVFFSPTSLIKLKQPGSVQFLSGKDSPYLLIEQNGRKSLYDRTGLRLFTGTFDKIQHAGDDLFILQRKDKRGLITKGGKLLLPVIYDAVGDANSRTVSLLQSGKFGLYDYVKKRQIPARYTKNLIPYNSEIIIAYRQGLYGFISWNNNPLGKFEFKEIQYWNDTTALVKKDSHWMLYHIATGTAVLDKIRSYKLIDNSASEKVAIVLQDMNHGVIHSKKGIVIPIAFSDIVNVGSTDKPMYFTEKHLEEASVFVVIYYDDEGQILRKEMYDQSDYDKIYCHSD